VSFYDSNSGHKNENARVQTNNNLASIITISRTRKFVQFDTIQ
jgi:hypothetical protein